jgi:hypothetical protein
VVGHPIVDARADGRRRHVQHRPSRLPDLRGAEARLGLPPGTLTRPDDVLYAITVLADARLDIHTVSQAEAARRAPP